MARDPEKVVTLPDRISIIAVFTGLCRGFRLQILNIAVALVGLFNKGLLTYGCAYLVVFN